MNPYDDTDPEAQYPEKTLSTQWELCASCNKALVLKPGDYCRTCAVIPPDTKEYMIVIPAKLDEIAEKTGLARAYLKTKMEHRFEHNQHLVVFKARGVWQEITISEVFPVRIVMERLFKRLED